MKHTEESSVLEFLDAFKTGDFKTVNFGEYNLFCSGNPKLAICDIYKFVSDGRNWGKLCNTSTEITQTLTCNCLCADIAVTVALHIYLFNNTLSKFLLMVILALNMIEENISLVPWQGTIRPAADQLKTVLWFAYQNIHVFCRILKMKRFLSVIKSPKWRKRKENAGICRDFENNGH